MKRRITIDVDTEKCKFGEIRIIGIEPKETIVQYFIMDGEFGNEKPFKYGDAMAINHIEFPDELKAEIAFNALKGVK